MAVVIGLVVGFAAGWAAHMLFGDSIQRFIRPEKSTPEASIIPPRQTRSRFVPICSCVLELRQYQMPIVENGGVGRDR